MPYGLSFNQCRGKPVTVRRKLLNSCREPRDEAKRRFPKLLERLSDCGQRRHGILYDRIGVSIADDRQLLGDADSSAVSQHHDHHGNIVCNTGKCFRRVFQRENPVRRLSIGVSSLWMTQSSLSHGIPASFSASLAPARRSG